jgi:hypothetical protein
MHAPEDWFSQLADIIRRDSIPTLAIDVPHKFATTSVRDRFSLLTLTLNETATIKTANILS